MRQGIMSTTTTRAKYLNGLLFKFSFSYNRYEKMTKLTRVAIRIVEENSLRLITMKTICNMRTFLLFTFSIFQHYYSHFAFKKNISSFFIIIVINNIYHIYILLIKLIISSIDFPWHHTNETNLDPS